MDLYKGYVDNLNKLITTSSIRSFRRIGVFIIPLSLLFYSFLRYLGGLRNSFSTVPFADSWALIDSMMKSSGTLTTEILWLPHNEHRIGFVRFLYYFNFKIFHGSELAFTVIHVSLLIFAAVIMSFVLARCIRLNQLLVFVFFFTLLTYFPLNSINIVWSFTMVFALSLIFPLISFISFANLQNSRKVKWFILFLLSELLLLSGGGAGVAALIAIPFLAVLFHCKRSELIMLIAFNTFLIFFYLRNLPQADHPPLHQLITFIPKYVLAYLGSPFMSFTSINRTSVTHEQFMHSLYFGILGLVIIAYALKILLRFKHTDQMAGVTTSFILFLLLVPCLASYSRTSFGLSHALTASYLFFSSTLYAFSSLVILGHSIHSKRLTFQASTLAVNSIIILTVCFLVLTTNRTSAYTDHFGHYKDRSGLSLMLRINDPVTQSSIYPVSPSNNKTLALTGWLIANDLGFTKNYFLGFHKIHRESIAAVCPIQLVENRIINSEIQQVLLIFNKNPGFSKVYLETDDFGIYLIKNEILNNTNLETYWGYSIKKKNSSELEQSFCISK
jgi:hypothetical protein